MATLLLAIDGKALSQKHRQPKLTIRTNVTLACERCVTNGYLQRIVWDVNGFS